MNFSQALFPSLRAGLTGLQTAVSDLDPVRFKDPTLLFGFEQVEDVLRVCQIPGRPCADFFGPPRHLQRLVGAGRFDEAKKHLEGMGRYIAGFGEERYKILLRRASSIQGDADHIASSGILYAPVLPPDDGELERLEEVAFNDDLEKEVQSSALLRLIHLATIEPKAVEVLELGGLTVFGPEHIRALAQAAVINFRLEQLLGDLSDAHLATGVIYNGDQRSAEQTRILETILQMIIAWKREGQTPVLVVDLDDTILSPRSRKVHVLRGYGKTHHNLPISFLLPTDIRWDPVATLLEGLGMDPDWVQAHSGSVMDYWNTHFFANESLPIDTAMPGAAEYLQQARALGASIVYHTGRDESRMRDGTVATLAKYSFPLPSLEGVQLIMKQESEKRIGGEMDVAERSAAMRTADVNSKEARFAHIRSIGPVAGSFDNETAMVNANVVGLHEGGNLGIAVRLDTASSGDVPLVQGAVTLSGFLR